MFYYETFNDLLHHMIIFPSKEVTAVVTAKVHWLNGQCDGLWNIVTTIPGETVAKIIATCSCLLGNALFLSTMCIYNKMHT